MAVWLIIGALLGADAKSAAPDPQVLARQIDRRLEARFVAETVQPAPRVDDAELLRRASLDLIGRIPTPREVREFLDDARSDQRALLIERLLSDREHARHFARVWRALLLPEATTEPQIRYFVPGFEAWLEQCCHENIGFDTLVRQLLTVPIARPDGPPEFVLRDLRKPNPLAFIASKGAAPDKIASSSVRLFLGLRLECAQCHDHPFDHWSRRQFWNQAAFFAGLERRGRGPFALLAESPERNSIPLMETAETVPALFLDLSQPRLDDGKSPRVPFAEWMTSPSNPYFARAVVNRVWSQLMGRGLVDPVDDFRDLNPPTHPELLNDFADAFVSSGFDMGLLLRTVCLTDAYQRSSRQTHDSQAAPERFARMAIKPLSGEQFFDSLTQAIGHEHAEEGDREDGEDDPLRRRVMAQFDDDAQTGDPDTSVAQALALMNGTVIQRAVSPATSHRLKRILQEHPDSLDHQVESLYLATLSRFPTAEERQATQDIFAQTKDSDRARRLGDVFWVLLNSPEFRWNH